MTLRKQKNRLVKAFMLGAIVLAGGIFVACDSTADDDAENTTDSDVVDVVDSTDVIEEPVDTFETDPGLDTIEIIDEVIEEE